MTYFCTMLIEKNYFILSSSGVHSDESLENELTVDIDCGESSEVVKVFGPIAPFRKQKMVRPEKGIARCNKEKIKTKILGFFLRTERKVSFS